MVLLIILLLWIRRRKNIHPLVTFICEGERILALCRKTSVIPTAPVKIWLRDVEQYLQTNFPDGCLWEYGEPFIELPTLQKAVPRENQRIYLLVAYRLRNLYYFHEHLRESECTLRPLSG